MTAFAPRGWLARLLPIVALAGCAGLPAQPAGQSERADPVWQRVRFRIHWDRQAAPSWHVDALLAHRVVAPALDGDRPALRLWRFHRRAADDATGHAFSFLTYAAPAVNGRLCLGFQSDPFLAELVRDGTIVRVECEGFGPEKGGLVEATSDPRWSPELQRSWPYFIMGASETWLRLVDEHARQRVPAGATLTPQEAERAYEQVDRAVTATWQQEGHHAFLHHLNALFGYAPINVGDPSPRRF